MTSEKKMEPHLFITDEKKDSLPHSISYSSSFHSTKNHQEEGDYIRFELMTCPTSSPSTTTAASYYSSFFLVQFFSFPPLFTPLFLFNEPQHFIFQWPFLHLPSLLLWYLSTQAQVKVYWIRVNSKGTPIQSSICSLPIIFTNWNSCSFSPPTLSTDLSFRSSSTSSSFLSIPAKEHALTETMLFNWKCNASANLIASLSSINAATFSNLSSSSSSSFSSSSFYTLHLSLELPTMTTTTFPFSTINTSSSNSNSNSNFISPSSCSTSLPIMNSPAIQWTMDVLHYRALQGHQFTLLLPKYDPTILEFLKAPKFIFHGQYLPSLTLASPISWKSSTNLSNKMTSTLVGPDLSLHPSFSLPLPSVLALGKGGGQLHVVLEQDQA